MEAVASGQWSVVGCQWSVASGRLPVVGCQWSVASGQLPVVSCQWSVARNCRGRKALVEGAIGWRRARLVASSTLASQTSRNRLYTVAVPGLL